MKHFKCWSLGVILTLSSVLQLSAQTITVYTNEGLTKTIANVDSIQFLNSESPFIRILETGHFSVKFSVNVPNGVPWICNFIPRELYNAATPEGYWLSRGVYGVGPKTYEVRNGEPSPFGKLFVAPFTEFCILLSEAKKSYDRYSGGLYWGINGIVDQDYWVEPPSESVATMFAERSELGAIPDYDQDLFLGKYSAESTNTDATFYGFFARQYLKAAASFVSTDTVSVKMKSIQYNAVSFDVCPPEKMKSFRMLFLSDEEFDLVHHSVGETGLHAYAYNHGEICQGTHSFCKENLDRGTHYHILVVGVLDEEGATQSFIHKTVTTTRNPVLEEGNSCPLDIVGSTNAYYQKVDIGNHRNDSIVDEFGVDTFTRVEVQSTGKNMDFTLRLPSLKSGKYKISVILVPTAYHKQLEEGLVNKNGQPYVEKLTFDATLLSLSDENNFGRSQAKVSNVTAPSESVAKIVLFEQYETSGYSDSDEEFLGLKISLTSRQTGSINSPKCFAVNLYKLIVEPCDF